VEDPEGDVPESTDEPGSEQEARPESERITRRRLVGTGVAAAGAAIVWGSPFPFSRKGIGQSIDSAYAATTGSTGSTGTHPHPQNPPASTAPPGRLGYCSVAGNTFPDGKSIPPGTFLDLQYGQPDTDPHYKGAYPANYIQGKGITCDNPPPGYVRDGFHEGPDTPSGVYPYFRKP
jgi:hypothetical protein